jgi:amidase
LSPETFTLAASTSRIFIAMPLHDPAHAFVPYPDAPVPRAATGPLADLSFAAKDLFDVAGYPTGGGNPIVLAMSGIKTRTAPTVQKLLDAGARFAGKTVTDELAFSMNGNNAHFGAPINGAAKERITGGSSSGSASAVSSGLCDFALGTDTGGSVRAPANHCGLYGLRPTHGRVSLEGALDLAPSFDTCGWFARDIGTFCRVADVLLGADATPLPAEVRQVRQVRQVRLLRPDDVWALAVPAARDALQGAADRAQALLGTAQGTAVALDSFDAMYWHFRYLQSREAWLTDGPLIERYAPPLGPGVAERFAWSRGVTDAQVATARTFRAAFRAHLATLLGNDGVLLMPTMPDIAPLRSDSEASLDDYRNRAIRMLCIAGLAGFPQLSMPLATRDGAPLGLSLLGPAGSDRSLVALAERMAG